MTRRALQDCILDAALAIADEQGWQNVRLHAVADRLQVGLGEIQAVCGELDQLADAWLERADKAMLAVRERPGVAELPARQRLYEALVAWFESLGGRRAMLRQVLAYKLRPPHLHLTLALIAATSRRVQWLREANHLDAGGRQRQIEETGLTLLFVAAVAVYLRDPDESFERTRRFLRARLEQADAVMRRTR